MTEVAPMNLNNKESKKVKKAKKQKKQIVYRTKEERQGEVKEILNQLSKFDLNIKYEPIKKLYTLFKEYINGLIPNLSLPRRKCFSFLS